jgi:hypothetical protein
MIRPARSLSLAGMLLRSFGRRVLRIGVLRSRSVRFSAAVGLIALLTICSSAAYYFLKPLVGDPATQGLLFDTATVSLILWTQIALLFVKVLFINAQGILELSFQLPITNRERSAAFLLYEMVMVGVVVGAGSASLAVSALLLLGPTAIPRLIESIILPVPLTYLALNTVYLLLSRLFALLRLRAVANVLLILSMFTLLIAYWARMATLVSEMGISYLSNRNALVWVTSISWTAHRYGLVPIAASSTLLALALMLATLWLAPSEHVPHSRYLDVPVGRLARRVLGPYDWCLLRDSMTTTNGLVALALFIYLFLNTGLHPLWSLSILSLGGLYQFASTRPLRGLVVATTSPWRVYGLLLRAQLVLIAPCALPGLLIVGLVKEQTAAQTLSALLGSVGGAILAVGIGITFPAEKENPFSVFIGLSATAALLGTLAIGLGVLQPSQPVTIGCLSIAVALFTWCSVQTIRASESRRRNEQKTSGLKLRRRGSRADASSGGDGTAVSHVLHR